MVLLRVVGAVASRNAPRIGSEHKPASEEWQLPAGPNRRRTDIESCLAVLPQSLRCGRSLAAELQREWRSHAFLVKRVHQPSGLISPSTILQALGAWKLAHASQRCVPFGLAWYETAF